MSMRLEDGYREIREIYGIVDVTAEELAFIPYAFFRGVQEHDMCIDTVDIYKEFMLPVSFASEDDSYSDITNDDPFSRYLIDIICDG